MLKEPSQTHPKQIRRKAISEGIQLSREDSRLYGVIHGMFNAKPDLAVAVPGVVVAYEAKFTQAFDPEQTSRTKKIAQEWSEILYEDLGFDTPPGVFLSTIGPAQFETDITWEWLVGMAGETLATEDRTLIALRNAVALLSGNVAGEQLALLALGRKHKWPRPRTGCPPPDRNREGVCWCRRATGTRDGQSACPESLSGTRQLVLSAIPRARSC